MRATWVFVLAACGGGVKDIEDTPRPAPEASCRAAGAKLTDLLVAGKDPPPPDDAVNAQIAKVDKQCSDNGWSRAAVTCFSKVRTIEEADACTKELTPAQLDALAGGKQADEGAAADPCDGGE